MPKADTNSTRFAPAKSFSNRRSFMALVTSAAIVATTQRANARPADDSALVPVTGAATSIDPTFGLIEAHRTASALHGAALKEQERLEQMDDPRASEIADAPCHADVRTFLELVNTAPQTLAGLHAWAGYLDELRGAEEWMIEDRGPAIVETLARSLEKLAGQFA